MIQAHEAALDALAQVELDTEVIEPPEPLFCTMAQQFSNVHGHRDLKVHRVVEVEADQCSADFDIIYHLACGKPPSEEEYGYEPVSGPTTCKNCLRWMKDHGIKPVGD